MKYDQNTSNQLKGIHVERLVRALDKDGWNREFSRGATQTFRHPDGRTVTIHIHPKKTFGPRLLAAILSDIGWSKEDLKRLKLIK